MSEFVQRRAGEVERSVNHARSVLHGPIGVLFKIDVGFDDARVRSILFGVLIGEHRQSDGITPGMRDTAQSVGDKHHIIDSIVRDAAGGILAGPG
jgi:hypothetical protein